jgi:hypothetical protein
MKETLKISQFKASAKNPPFLAAYPWPTSLSSTFTDGFSNSQHKIYLRNSKDKGIQVSKYLLNQNDQ